MIYILSFNRSVSNSMDKGACNFVHYQNSNMASTVTMYIIGYIIPMHNRDVHNEPSPHRTL